MHLDSRKLIFVLAALFGVTTVAEDIPTPKNNTEVVKKTDPEKNNHLTDKDKPAENKEQVESSATTEENEEEPEETIDTFSPKVIKDIILTRVEPNKYVTDEAILSCIPYREGEQYDRTKTSIGIQNLFELEEPIAYFQDVKIMGEYPNSDEIILHIITCEKPELETIKYEGNKKVSCDDIEEKLHLNDIHALNENDKDLITLQLKKIYKDKNFHLAEIDVQLEKKANHKVDLIIKIKENVKSLIKRVHFKGNENISSKKLRNIIFTREDWILSLLDKSGTYKKEAVETDKRIIENHYKTNGFLTATVNNVDIKMDPKTKQYDVIFNVVEGDQYTIKSVKAEGNNICPEDFIVSRLPVQQGQLYSVKTLRDSIEALRLLWGKYGYAFADIEPLVVPNDKDKTVTIDFHSDLGNKIYINRINILGNNKTKDKVIRRKITLREGCLISTPDMENSKDRVESLSYFDPRDGVIWKTNRIDEKWADLDLIVKEAKTGRAGIDFTSGGSPTDRKSNSSSFKFGAYVTDPNWMGSGVSFSTSAHWSKQEWDMNFNLSDNWFLDRPLFSDIDINVIKSDYTDQLKSVNDFEQRIISAYYGLGFVTSPKAWVNDTSFVWRTGIEKITQTAAPTVDNKNAEGATSMQKILNKMFQPGKVITFEQKIARDLRNSSIHPSNGLQWSLGYKLGHGLQESKYGYARMEFEASYYTPIIAPRQLVLGLHGFVGLIGKTGKNKTLPYRELFHVGGQASVRGFDYGQIGPMYMGDSIGAKKAFFWNAELVFPISQDFSMKGAFFYDGGAGWDTPNLSEISQTLQDKFLKNNKFEYRHSVGIGLRMLKPQPVKIDWAFKLDKKKGEKSHELHLSAYREF
jgi:outer membrane protein insertion porin family